MADDNDVDLNQLPHTTRDEYLDRVEAELTEAPLAPARRAELWGRYGAPDALVDVIPVLADETVATRQAFVDGVADSFGFGGDAIRLAALTVADGADVDVALAGVSRSPDRAERMLHILESVEPPRGTLVVLAERSFSGSEAAALLRMLDAAEPDLIPTVLGDIEGLGPEGCSRLLESTMRNGQLLRNEVAFLLPVYTQRKQTLRPPELARMKQAGGDERAALLQLRSAGRFGTAFNAYFGEILRQLPKVPKGMSNAIVGAHLQDDIDTLVLSVAMIAGNPGMKANDIVSAVKRVPATARDVLSRDIQHRQEAARTASGPGAPVGIDRTLVEAIGDRFQVNMSGDFVRVVLVMLETEPKLSKSDLRALIDQCASVQRGSTWQRVLDRFRKEPESVLGFRTEILTAARNHTGFSDRHVDTLLLPAVDPSEAKPADQAPAGSPRPRRRSNVSPDARGH